jgi:hypothetical protein
MKTTRYAGAMVLAATVVAIAAAPAGAHETAATVSGRWTMTVEGGAHAMPAMGLALKQDGAKVTGTFASPHGDVPVQGEFKDDTLTLVTTAKDADSPSVTFNATLKDDKLTGYLSGPMGDMTWTATRVKGQ